MHNRRSGIGILPVFLIAAFAALVVSAAPASAFTQPLRVSSNGRFLVTGDGTPFFWQGDTAWRLYKLDREDVVTYLDNRRAKGFNVIQGPVLSTEDGSIENTNAYGDHNTDPIHPNSAWFNHIDFIVDTADSKGMYVALVTMWGGAEHILGSNQSQRIANATTYGTWLGNRYRNKNNVIWIVAGEYAINGIDDDTRAVWNAIGDGLRAGSGGNALITIHGSYQEGLQSSSVAFQDASWLSFNMIQSSQSGNTGAGADNWTLVTNDYHETPTKPTIDGEAHYEDIDGWDAFGVRRRAYWSVFAGAFGHTYGQNSVSVSYRGGADDQPYGTTTPWWDALDEAGAFDMRFLKELMQSRPMLTRVPANAMLVTPSGGVPDRIIATRDQQRRYAMFYVPKKNKSFTVNTSLLNGTKLRAWWYDPRNGKATNSGTFNRGGFRTFTTPNKGQDWVLILDDTSQGFPAPGVGGPIP